MTARSFLKHFPFCGAGPMLALAMAAAPAAAARADELQVLAGGGFSAPLTQIAADFERASGHKVALRFGTTPELIRMVNGGDAFDVAVAPREVFADAQASSHFAAGSHTGIARVGLGVAVRAGAPRPDIGTPEAFRRALLQARSVATVPASAAGAQVLRVFERLGIAQDMRAKTQAQAAPAQIVEAVTRGDADLGIFLVNVLTVPGLDVVGPFPAEVQQEVQYVAGVSAGTAQAQAARSFIDYLKGPAAGAVIQARGLRGMGE